MTKLTKEQAEAISNNTATRVVLICGRKSSPERVAKHLIEALAGVDDEQFAVARSPDELGRFTNAALALAQKDNIVFVQLDDFDEQ